MRGRTSRSNSSRIAKLSASSFTAPICTTSLNSPGASQWRAIEHSQAVNSRSKTVMVGDAKRMATDCPDRRESSTARH